MYARINDRKQMLHSSLCTSSVQSCYRYRLFKLRNGAPFYTLCGVPNYEFHSEVDMKSDVIIVEIVEI